MIKSKHFLLLIICNLSISAFAGTEAVQYFDKNKKLQCFARQKCVHTSTRPTGLFSSEKVYGYQPMGHEPGYYQWRAAKDPLIRTKPNKNNLLSCSAEDANAKKEIFFADSACDFNSVIGTGDFAGKSLAAAEDVLTDGDLVRFIIDNRVEYACVFPDPSMPLAWNDTPNDNLTGRYELPRTKMLAVSWDYTRDPAQNGMKLYNDLKASLIEHPMLITTNNETDSGEISVDSTGMMVKASWAWSGNNGGARMLKDFEPNQFSPNAVIRSNKVNPFGTWTLILPEKEGTPFSQITSIKKARCMLYKDFLTKVLANKSIIAADKIMMTEGEFRSLPSY